LVPYKYPVFERFEVIATTPKKAVSTARTFLVSELKRRKKKWRKIKLLGRLPTKLKPMVADKIVSYISSI
jgi:hypothetical protein